jgi:magnesium transporter
MRTIISYNEREVRYNGSKDDITEGYNVWIDLINPTPAEISTIQQTFRLDRAAFEEYLNKSKKPQVRVLDNYKFVLALDMKFRDASTLLTEGVYLFVGRGWLITAHSDKVDLQTRISNLFKQKNRTITESSIDALFYSILANLIDSYEQILTGTELSISEVEQRSLYRPSKKMLEYLDSLSRQMIILRRHFWHMRNVINFLTHIEEDKEDVKYIKVVYDDINQLIELIESYRDTINSTRELYVASVSLQLNDTMKTLTIFSAILLPLTFLTSIYGMNGVDLSNLFDLPIGLAVLFAIMAIVTGGLFIYFKKKQWILVGKDYASNNNNKKTEKNKSNYENKDGGGREVAEDQQAHISSSDKSQVGKQIDTYSNPSNKLAKNSADKIKTQKDLE